MSCGLRVAASFGGDEVQPRLRPRRAVSSRTHRRAHPGLPGPDALLNRSNPNASIVVDFRNMPRGTRTETRADSDVDLEVTTGYSMQGAQ